MEVTVARSHGDGEGDRARKACLTCRRQKMKCVPGNGASCRRCQRMQKPCIFRPRANAASPRDPLMGSNYGPTIDYIASPSHGDASVLRRLDRIEAVLGLSTDRSNICQSGTVDTEGEFEGRIVDAPLAAISRMKGKTEPGNDPMAWKPATVKRLWQSFHEAMPGLHFLPKTQVFTSPTPLLLAAMLHCSSSRGTGEVSKFAPTYYTVMCAEVSALVQPAGEPVNTDSSDVARREEWAFQTVLAIILGALLSEATNRVTGLWISVAYRILLENCPPRLDEESPQWQQLFLGLQILDLEHASLHLSCPSIPIEPPLGVIQISRSDQLYPLSRMMHVGLTHFTGRGFRTIWSYFAEGAEETSASAIGQSLSGVDAAVIRDWARQLDEWLAHFSNGPFESDFDRILVYRQYILHRLCVLSIYLPSRNYDLFSAAATPRERHELLLSARATIRLHANDGSIWSNFDFIMITWAALIVLQALKGGYGEPGDTLAIRVHLNLLRQTNEPAPNLRLKLGDRLDRELQDVPDDVRQQETLTSDTWTGPVGYPWSIFDEASLQSFDQLFWPVNEGS